MLDKNKFIHSVPKGIRYISDWKEFEIFNFPHILDKQIPGCGFTEYCITNKESVILCSPRKILLENKYDQHPEDVFLVRAIENITKVDIDLETTKLTKSNSIVIHSNVEDTKRADDTWKTITTQLRNYVDKRLSQGLTIKILVTYDSFRRLKEQLDKILDNYKESSADIDLNYRVVVDEFQSIFTDSRFKSTTELEFVNVLQGIKKVCYVSATPMISTYLKRLAEFRDLPFYGLDWKTEDPGRVQKPTIVVRPLNGIKQLSRVLIDPYITGEFYREIKQDHSTGEFKEFISRELIIYVNSVSNIISIIKACKLTSDQVNILCANTKDNEAVIKRLNYKSTGLGKGFEIGRVPTRDEPRKMVTLCTRTVYLGADFYSDNARSVVISDANVECMAVDITLDLPQILGRQRLSENPWKNEAYLYVKCITPGNVQYKEEFEALKKKKKEETKILLSIYDESNIKQRDILINRLEDLIDSLKFRKDYVAVNNHAGNHKIPVENKLVEISEERAFDIQQVEYSSRFLVFSTIKESLRLDDINEINTGSEVIEKFLNLYKKCETSTDRLKVICSFKFYKEQDQKEAFLNYVPLSYRNYYYGLGPSEIKRLGYNVTRLKSELNKVYGNSDILKNLIFQDFVVDSKLSTFYIKSKLKEIYASLSYDKTPKASDLSEWFDIKPCKIKDAETGKWEHGFEILKVK